MSDGGVGPRPLVLAAPSGTGKTTIARTLVEDFEDFVFSVSATTRSRRGREKDGVDYDFVSVDEFRRLLDAGELVEWAEVHGNLYGTPRANLDAAARDGRYAVLDIDVQGARQIRERAPEALLVFVLPPSARALVTRLSKRGTEHEREVVRRLRNAREELLAAPLFDHVVVNEDLAETVEGVRALARGEAAPDVAVSDVEGRVAELRTEIDEILSRSFRASGTEG